jgi:SWI/SNF-related matrix-associated actin-dependent regulator of chromatin subfamily A3
MADVSRHIFRGTLRYCKYHGQDRSKDPSALVQYDVVLTTYGTVVADFSRSRNVLDHINWYRLIVDEGMVASRAKG